LVALIFSDAKEVTPKERDDTPRDGPHEKAEKEKTTT